MKAKPIAQPMIVKQEADRLVIEVPLAVRVQTNLRHGDRLYAVPTSLGLEITRLTPEEIEVVMDGRRFMQRHAKAMRALATGEWDDDKDGKPRD